MTKTALIALLAEKLRLQVEVMRSALADSNENATGDQTKAEGKYDTRAVEAAYLAGAQTKQLALAEGALRKLGNFAPPAFSTDEEISAGALVELESDGELAFYLLAPAGGGLSTDYLGCEATVITPDSRLYQQLVGKKPGEPMENPGLEILGVE